MNTITYQNIAHKTGIAPAVLFGLFPCLNWIVVVLLFKRGFGKQELSEVPLFVVSNQLKLHFGHATVCGALYLWLGILSTFSMSDQTDHSWAYFISGVPWFCMGALLLLHGCRYNDYKKKLEIFLYKYEYNPDKDIKHLSIFYKGKTYNYEDMKSWIDDLKRNNLLPQRAVSPDAHREANHTNMTTWDCPSCGAQNTTGAGVKVVCEYCGREE